MLTALVALQLWAPSFGDTPRFALFDLLQKSGARDDAPVHRVVLVAIDNDSIARIGQWPWPRDVLARLVDSVNTEVIGIGMVLSEPDRTSMREMMARDEALPPDLRAKIAAMPSNDERLATAIARRRVVLASAVGGVSVPEGIATRPVFREIGGDIDRFLPAHATTLRPLAILARAAAGEGEIGVTPSRDGIARRLPAITRTATHLAPGFAVEVLRVAENAARIDVEVGSAGIAAITLGDRAIPLDAAGFLWPRLADSTAIDIIPAWRILAGEIDPRLATARIALIGTTALGLDGAVPTLAGRTTAAIEVQARAVAGLLNSDLLSRPAHLLFLELLATAVAGAVVILVARHLPATALLVALPFAILALGAIAWTLFRTHGVLFDTGFAIVTTLVMAALAVSLLLIVEVRARRLREQELERALLNAAAADRAKTDFLANMSHELRTPLTAIIGFAEMMQLQTFGPISPPRYGGYVADIRDSARHLLALIDDMLDMSLIELGRMTPNRQNIDIASIVTSCLVMIGHRLSAQRIRVTHRVPGDLPPVHADPKMLRQMLLNLLGNAVKFSPEEGAVEIEVMLAEGAVVIAVRDEGPGIAEADIPRALERFQKLSAPTVANPSGIGLGLPLTKAMIEMHGGSLAVTRRSPIGTEVSLRVPLHPSSS